MVSKLGAIGDAANRLSNMGHDLLHNRIVLAGHRFIIRESEEAHPDYLITDL